MFIKSPSNEKLIINKNILYFLGADMTIGCDFCGNDFMSTESIVGNCQYCGKKVCYFCSETSEKELENGTKIPLITCPDCYEIHYPD